jgi:hypothetical protein
MIVLHGIRGNFAKEFTLIRRAEKIVAKATKIVKTSEYGCWSNHIS